MAKILVVDDETEILEFLRIRLEKAGFDVLTAGGGMDGLEQARTAAPDLIILDMMMPQIDGLKICKMLKFDRKYEHIPIILLTARDLSGEQDMLVDLRVNKYVSKPFDATALIEDIKSLLPPSPDGQEQEGA